MIERIEQTNPHNCGSACLAMVLGLTVDAVETEHLQRRIGELRDPEPDPAGSPDDAVIGVTSFEIQAVLWDLRIRNLYLSVPRNPEHENATWYDRTGRDMPVLRQIERIGAHLDRNGVAILGVDSLRYKDGKHWIVAQGHDLFDPAPLPGPIYSSLSERGADNPIRVWEAILIEASQA